MEISKLKKIITLGALLIALVHIIWPDVAVDGVTLVLLFFALLPWLAPIFKSLELPGGLKVEFQELEKASARADAIGLLSNPEPLDSPPQYSFQLVANHDPNLALAGLRIEIEKRLIELAQQRNIGTKMQGLGRLMNELAKQGVLTNDEHSVLADLTGLLNTAVHAGRLDFRASQWAMDVGPRLLQSLDDKVMEYK
jgi:hypothetical protein